MDRDNLLDPKNPDSKSDKVILLEAFVNTNNPLPYNDYALDAIDELELDDNLSGRLIVVEYHRNVSNSDYNDVYTLSGTESWYEHYITVQESKIKGAPDIFINGAYDRVQGASSTNNVVNRVKKYMTNQLIKDSEYTIEADANQNGNEIDGKFRVARLGNKSADEMVLRVITIYNASAIDTSAYNVGRRAVSYFEDHLISEINAGDYIEENFHFSVSGSKAEKIIFVLMDSNMLNILHAIEKEIL